MNRLAGVAQRGVLLVVGLSLIGGCTPSGSSQDFFVLVTGGVQNLITFATDFALQVVTALLF